jgi:hypothetical protein
MHETEDEIGHKVIQMALLPFLMNLFNAALISHLLLKFTLFRMLWGMITPILECQHSLRCKLEMGAEHYYVGKIAL